MKDGFPVATPDAPPHVRKAVEEYAKVLARNLEIRKKEHPGKVEGVDYFIM